MTSATPKNTPACYGTFHVISRDSEEHVKTILRKGKLNKEGISLLKMSDEQKHKEMHSVLRDMILQKKKERQAEKQLSQDEYQLTLQEMYYPNGLELY